MAARIHIVEDDEALRDLLDLLLQAHGYTVEAFASGAEFFRDRSQCADCVILDVGLPGDTGFEVLARLRQRGCVTPAIFLSGAATPAMRAQAASAHALAFFEKPMRPADLLAAIAQATASSAAS